MNQSIYKTLLPCLAFLVIACLLLVSLLFLGGLIGMSGGIFSTSMMNWALLCVLGVLFLAALIASIRYAIRGYRQNPAITILILICILPAIVLSMYLANSLFLYAL